MLASPESLPSPPDKVTAVLDYLNTQSGICAARKMRIGPDGQIIQRVDGQPLRFRFTCYGIEFAAVASENDDKGLLTLEANLGHIPYTAEAAEVRRRMLDLVQSRTHLLTTTGRDVGVRGNIPVTLPLTPVNVITAATAFMLEVEPEIEQLAGCLPPS